MAGATFLVEFRGPGGAREVVRVWASNEGDAISRARSWIQGSQTMDYRDGFNGPFDGPARARAQSSSPSADAVGVATSDEEVAYRFIAPDGRWLPIRDDPVRFDAQTETFRSSDRWQEARSSMSGVGLAPEDVIVLSLSEDPGGAIVLAANDGVAIWLDPKFLTRLPPEGRHGLPVGWRLAEIAPDERYMRWLARAGRDRLRAQRSS
jgi:hypothetical protein